MRDFEPLPLGIRCCPVNPRTRLGTAYRRTRGLTQPVRTRCQFVGWSVKGRSPRLPADPYLPYQSIPFAPFINMIMMAYTRIPKQENAGKRTSPPGLVVSFYGFNVFLDIV